jgi:DNA-binding transcriptional ArsR family regulator
MLNEVDIWKKVDIGDEMEPACAERVYRALKAICHPLRVKIIQTLADGELCVRDLVERTGTSQSSISQHLGILHDKSIVASRKEANLVYYRVPDPRIFQLIATMRMVFCARGQH